MQFRAGLIQQKNQAVRAVGSENRLRCTGGARRGLALAGGCSARREGGDMIAVPAGVRVLVATKPVDFRKGGDGLVALVRETLGHDPFSGTVFVFRSKRADRVKMVAWDGSGLVLLWKRLENGAFKWPPISDGVMRLTSAQLAALVDGMDWSRLHTRNIVQPTATS
jgi:transposase